MGIECPQLGQFLWIIWSCGLVVRRMDIQKVGSTKKDIEALGRELGPMNDSPTMLIRLF